MTHSGSPDVDPAYDGRRSQAATSTDVPAIVVGCYKAGLAVIRALGVMGCRVIGLYYNDGHIGRASRYLSERHLAPNPAEEDAFVAFLLAKASLYPGAVVIPTDDASLVCLARHRALLSTSFRIAAPDWATAERFIDKDATYRILSARGVPCPRNATPHDLDEAHVFLEEIGFPCLLKPAQGHVFYERHGTKMILLEDMAMFEEMAASQDSWDSAMMLSEYIPGPETNGFTYYGFLVDGHPLVEMTAQKLGSHPIGTGFPTRYVTRAIPALCKLGRRAAEAMSYTGYCCIEFKLDERDAQFKLLDFNGRHNLSGMLPLKCGINFPWLTYLLNADQPLTPVTNRAPEGVYWLDLANEAASLAAHLRRRTWPDSGPLLRPYRSRRVFAVESILDPGPAFAEVALAMNSLNRRRGQAADAADRPLLPEDVAAGPPGYRPDHGSPSKT